jgi:exopolysaccharide production protein ExoY
MSPAFLVVAAAIFLLSRRSPLVADFRVGLNGCPFWMLKFRTMWPKGGYTSRQYKWIERLVRQDARPSKTVADPRVSSSFAAFCRRHSIDELPQLWNVVQGFMSFVGPRPVTSSELEAHYGADAGEVLASRPGLSGLWQVVGRSRLTYGQRRRLDLRLVRRLSPGLYFAILRRTVRCVINGKSAW